MNSFGRQLERNIIIKINKIDKGEMTAKESGLNKMIARLKQIDKATAEDLQIQYVAVVIGANRRKD